MAQIGIVYGSTTGNTTKCAEKIQQLLGKEQADLLNIAKAEADDLNGYPNLILGTSTWGYGDLQDDWESKLAMLKEINWQGKKVALFGLGDQEAYSSTFLDAMGTLYNTLIDAGATCIGAWPTEGYTFDESTAVVDDRFVGLALDEENQEDKMDERIQNWLNQLEGQWA
jgi:flavodoxin I